MKIRLVYLLLIFACAQNGYAQKPANDSNKDTRASLLPNNKTSFTIPVAAKPVTVNQVERQTGGKVIGAKPVNVQGRQLNQIKVRMPNGRIVIPQQLFDENGRSVDTVEDVEIDPELGNKATDH